MKNIFKISLFSIIPILLLLFGIKNVNAESYVGQAIWPSEWVPNIYVRKYKGDGTKIKYQQLQFIRRSEDNHFVYCLQPFVDIDNNLPYYDVIRSDYETVLNMTEEQWNKISLLAYYGYMYDQDGYNHKDVKWYGITQVLIWRVAEPNTRIIFTDKLNGKEVPNKYDKEIKELEDLVNNHYKRPLFEDKNLTLSIGQNKTLIDKNDVLKHFTISSTENVNANIEGNKLNIKANKVGEGKINLVKKSKKYSEPPIVYFSNHSQNVLYVGYYDPIPAQVKLNILGGKVEMNKLDSETKQSVAQGDALLANAIYGIYNLNNEKIAELKTNDKGYAISDFLPSLGEYYLKEIKAPEGYELDKNKYSFVIDENNLIPKIDVYEKVIDSNLNIFKVHASDKTGILVPEPNVKFDIYLKSSNQKVDSITTDKNGNAVVNLPYGTYIFKQITSTPNFEKVKDFEVIINEKTEENIYKLISNAEVTAKLKVVKIDSETKKVINRSGIKFKIKSLNTNEYVCQTITYPTAKKICEYETDANGIMITPYPLLSGKYILEEVDQKIDGYLWNKESLPFEIKEGANFINDEKYGVIFETKFENKPVKGRVIINKFGEKVKGSERSVNYKKIPLDGIKFGLYDSNNNLIKEVITEDDGYACISNLKLGKYYLKELETLPDYVLDENKYEFELKYKDQYTEVIEYNFNLTNKLKKGSVEFTKIDFADSTPIPNTKIEIYNKYDDIVFSGITDKDGKIVVNELPKGKYYIVETEPSTGYVITDEKVFFEIKENGEIVKANMKNKKITGDLLFTKTDISNSNPLPNTKIEIYNNEDKIIFEGITDDKGQIEIKGLEYGKYYILEKEAPEGYKINPDKMYFEIKINGEVVKATMVDEKIEIDVPNTFISDNYLLEIITIGSLLLGSGMVIYGIKKKRK